MSLKKQGDSGTHQDSNLKLQVLGHFRLQIGALSDQRTLELLASFGESPFTNSEARSFLQVKRQATWKHLARLVQLGLLEKRGHVYRVSRFTKDFLSATSSTFIGLMTGVRTPVTDQKSVETLQTALDGIEALYAKGRLRQEDYRRHRKILEEIIGNVSTTS
jgi:hypothetical protein